MNRLHFYKYAAITLLVINIIGLTFLMLSHKPPKGQTLEKRADEIMNFDKMQHQAFLKMAGDHKILIDSINNQQRAVLKPFFKTLSNPDDQINKDSLTALALKLEKSKIESTYLHFEEIKSILHPEQIPAYQVFIDQAINRILINKQNRPKPRRKSEQ